MAVVGLSFEKPVIELESKIEELKNTALLSDLDISNEIAQMQSRLEKIKEETYSNLTRWQKVQIARHPQRPYTLDYIGYIMRDFVELHGDRHFADDKAIICGLAKIEDQKVLIVGHQKGKDTNENLKRNFGSAHPEGYRKAMRFMKLAEKFHLPIISFIDTPGAYPGIGAEERGQSEAIAFNLREMSDLKVPILIYVIGEGGSGGALGIGVGDRAAVLEYAYYSVISPEGCAAILWKDRTKAEEAAESLKFTAEDLLKFKIIDEIIKEPLGGAHRDAKFVAGEVKKSILKNLQELKTLSPDQLLDERYQKYRRIGEFIESA